ncbi:AraC family transcriptional regulator [Paenibacillus beijingensis]|uniref:AraC family transcriptional regulator n=1 Tax=Paenibacillus beijingensis TaxID=1126833 RepID=A0A0D5NNL5_9BACL|nr:AraC family transcriptional regulator [Paenibacillus beijingensis]AJY76866.1 AraC family transcriptional regulator [Paenibacillus beijingensis]
MDWLKRMNGALEYIEDNLAGEIDFNTAARIACCSVYHFQRMFSFMTDIPLSEYIRRRRLTLAAFELQQSEIKVIDLGLKYGYESPEAFTRAFQKMHGVTPTLSRQKGISLKSYPRLSFHITIRGAEEMNYKIIEKEAFTVFGVEELFTMENGENLKGIPQMWQRLLSDGTVDRIGQASDKVWNESNRGIMPVNAVMCYREADAGRFPYMICGFMPDSGLVDKEDYTVAQIPALTWAVFTTEEYTRDQTVSQIQNLWKRIYTEWFPMSSYEALSGPQFEMYGIAESGNSYCEVWIPVVHK